MGCCESVEVDEKGKKANHSKPGGQSSGATKGEEKALRKVDCSEETKEIICGGLRIRYAFVSQKGYYPDNLNKANQDSYSVHEKFGVTNSEDAFFAVYDGHGEFGDHCAQFARDKLPEYLSKYINKAKAKEATKPEVVKAIEDSKLMSAKNKNKSELLAHVELSKDQMHRACSRAHLECNSAMHRAVDDRLSGTTAISAFIHGRRNRVTICNVGDSRAVLGKKSTEENGYGQNQALKAFPLSRDQTPYRKDERIRIRKTGARILSLDQLEGLEPIIDKDDDPDNDEGDIELGEELDEGGDPPRVWSPNGDYPGTAFTRSLGDYMAEELGVFAEPEMLTRDIKPEDRVIVIASDGIFEFLTNQSVIDICAKFSDPLAACRKVVAESYELWLQYELRTDDITIICMFVEHAAEAAAMEKEFVTTSKDGKPSEEAEVLASTGARPIRTKMTKEKAQEIEKLKQNSSFTEDEIAELNKSVDLSTLITVKSASEKARISDAIEASTMFKNITESQREMIYAVMEPIKVKKGEWVIKQGSVGDRFYIIDEGTFEVRIVRDGQKDEGNGGEFVHSYEGSVANHLHPCFGELALMYSAPRSASVIACTDGALFGLHRSAFRQVLAQTQGTRKALMKIITKIPLYMDLNDEGVSKLASAFNEIAFGPEEDIVKQGHSGASMYVITSGTCECVKVVKGEPQNVTLKAGDHFGDEVILDGDKYAATVISLQTVTGWKIDRNTLASTIPVDKLRKSTEH